MHAAQPCWLAEARTRAPRSRRPQPLYTQAANLEFRSSASAPPGPAPATPGDPAVPLVPFAGQGGGARKEWFGQVGQAVGCGLEERRGMAAAQPKMSLPALTDQSRLAKDQAPREQ